ncbi:hypothetical protein JOE61_003877 [Nocardioides salarius]|uniref:Phage tail collar domain-containing protein n=1 Tax=Nocardioides salarius TaxID=374513 RepID=A0ABS2MFU8_9ACTN|nr:tail fiber protein [Nocardioides salarius]MBM7510063.1 hypothetical protein [Nocardioides salarius]
MAFRINRTRVASVAVASVALTAAVSGAYATSAANEDDGVINACFRLKTGDLRLEKANRPCATDAPKWRLREKRISWNEEGLPGADGLAGADGTAGADGQDGSQGPMGEPGAEGPRGAVGPAGPVGPIGLIGPMGLPGLDGKDGADGTDGQDGQDGQDGSDGRNGLDGLAGVDGNTVLSGEGAPAIGYGGNGDFYYDTTATTLYGPKVDDTWPTGISLKGPQGEKGERGLQGLRGEQGLQGLPGDAGKDGAQGPQGIQGLTGPTGPVGPEGPAGPGADLFGTNTGNAAAGRGWECTMGEITLTAAVVGGGLPARGQLLSISQNQALFSLLGTTYGGDGRTTFALPDLRDAAPNGMSYMICDQGIYPSRL